MSDEIEFCTVRWTATSVQPHDVHGPHRCGELYAHETHRCCCGATLTYEVWPAPRRADA